MLRFGAGLPTAVCAVLRPIVWRPLRRGPRLGALGRKPLLPLPISHRRLRLWPVNTRKLQVHTVNSPCLEANTQSNSLFHSEPKTAALEIPSRAEHRKPGQRLFQGRASGRKLALRPAVSESPRAEWGQLPVVPAAPFALHPPAPPPSVSCRRKHISRLRTGDCKNAFPPEGSSSGTNNRHRRLRSAPEPRGAWERPGVKPPGGWSPRSHRSLFSWDARNGLVCREAKTVSSLQFHTVQLNWRLTYLQKENKNRFGE